MSKNNNFPFLQDGSMDAELRNFRSASEPFSCSHAIVQPIQTGWKRGTIKNGIPEANSFAFTNIRLFKTIKLGRPGARTEVMFSMLLKPSSG